MNENIVRYDQLLLVPKNFFLDKRPYAPFLSRANTSSNDRIVATATISRNFDSLFEFLSVINEECPLSLF